MNIDNLKKARENTGLTQSQVADRLGISDGTYKNYEQGKREPNNTLLLKIADLYGVTTDYLLGREPAPAPIDPFDVLGLKKSVDDDEFIRLYSTLPDYAKQIFVDTMAKLAQATAGNMQKKSTRPTQPIESPQTPEPSIVQSAPQGPPQSVVNEQQPKIETSEQKQWRMAARSTDGRYVTRTLTPEEVENLLSLDEEPEF